MMCNSSLTLKEELFVEAASDGDVKALTDLIPDLINLHGFSVRLDSALADCLYEALQLAAEHGHAQAVHLILWDALKKLPLEKPDHELFLAPLTEVYGPKNVLALRTEVYRPWKWYFDESGATLSPLHLAVREGHLSVVQEFVSFFQQYPVTDVIAELRSWRLIKKRTVGVQFWGRRQTAGRKWLQGLVEWAMRWGQSQVLQLLLTLQQPLHLPALPSFMYAINKISLPGLLHLAAHYNHLEALTWLLDQRPLISEYFEIPSDSSNLEVDGLTALHVAAHSASAQVVKALVEIAKIPVNSRSSPELFTALHVAASSGNLEVVKLLLFYKRRLNHYTNLNKPSEYTASTSIIASPSHDDHGPWEIDVWARDCMGRTALHYASRHGHVAVVQELLDCFSTKERQQLYQHERHVNNYIVSVADHDGLLPLHMAARSGHDEVIEKLLQFTSQHLGVNTDQAFNVINQQAKHSLRIKKWIEREYMGIEYSKSDVDNYGYSAPTVYHGQVYVFMRPKLMDSLFFQTKGFTPLHFAARYGHEGACRQLMQVQVKGQTDQRLSLTDDGGFSAHDWMELVGPNQSNICSAEENEYANSNTLRKERKISETTLMQMVSDLREESKALDSLRRAWERGCRPPITAEVVKWLEGDEIGRVRSYWLQRWVRRACDNKEKDQNTRIREMVRSLLAVLKEFEATSSRSNEGCLHDPLHTDALTASIKAYMLYRVNDEASKSNMLVELLLHLPEDVDLRAKKSFKALKHATGHGMYVTAKAIVLKVPEVTRNESVHEVVELALDEKKKNPKGKTWEDFMVALVTREGLWNESNLLRDLLTRKDVRAETRLVEAILGRAEVKKGLYEDRQVYMDCASAMLVGAALIAGVAFQGWLQPPLGFTYNYTMSHEAGAIEYVQVHRWGVRWFWRFNNGAFFLAVATLIAGAKGALPVAKELDLVKSLQKAQRAVAVSSTFLSMALMSFMLAFIMAQIAVLPPLASDRRMALISALAGGGVLCALLLLWFIGSVWPLLPSVASFYLIGFITFTTNIPFYLRCFITHIPFCLRRFITFTTHIMGKVVFHYFAAGAGPGSSDEE